MRALPRLDIGDAPVAARGFRVGEADGPREIGVRAT